MEKTEKSVKTKKQKEEVRMASSGQTYALYRIFKKDYRGEGLTFDEANKMIKDANAKNGYVSKAKEGRSILSVKSPAEEKQKASKSLARQLFDYMMENRKSIIEQVKAMFKIESVVMNDTKFIKDDGKRYAFIGGGFGFAWLDFDKRSKKATSIMEAYSEISEAFENSIIEEVFTKEQKNYYNKIGTPVKAVFAQDMNIKASFMSLVASFMEEQGIKNVYLKTRDD